MILLATASVAWADDPGGDERVIRVGVYQNQPKIFTDEDGEPAGLFVELFNAIAKNEGWNPVYVPCRWADCLQALEEGNLDLMPDVAYSRERAVRLDFHQIPVAESWSRFYGNPHSSINSLADLKDKRVAVLRGSVQQTDFAEMMTGFGFHVEVVPTDTLEEAFELARRGHVDAAIANHFFGDFFYRQYSLVKTPIVFNMSQLYFATRKGSHADLLQAIDRHLASWRKSANSTYYLALGRWMEKPPQRLLPPYVAGAIAVVLGLLVLAAIIILMLRYQVRKRTRRLWQANLELHESEQQYRHLFENMAQGVVYRGPDGRVIDANPAAERILGVSVEQLRGSVTSDPRWHFLHADGSPSGGDEHPAVIALRTGQPVLGVLMGVFHPIENRPHWVLVDSIPEFRPGESRPFRVFTTFSDITARWEAERALDERTTELNEALLGTISVMSLTVEKRDPYTAGHQLRVAKLARALAERMGLNNESVEGLYLAGVIHDIGKISIPAEILAKPGRLSEEEYAIIRRHPHTAYEILAPIKFPWPIAQIVYQHHERLDGSGYPCGLIGEQILLEARVLAVADVLETMTLRRPYRPALGIQAALAEIVAGRGLRYDAAVVDACNSLFQNGAVDFSVHVPEALE